MNLGWCDVCLRVRSAQTSLTFYKDLGFWKVEGVDDEGWAVITNGDLRLGLFEAQYFQGDNTFSLNFRGGDVRECALEIQSKGHRLSNGPIEGKSGGYSATLFDPDGYAIFLDAAPNETKMVDPID